MRALLLAPLVVLTACASPAEPTRDVVSVVPPTTLRSLAASRGFTMGAAARVDLLNGQYQQVLAAQYNGVTTEGAMKFSYIHPSLGQYAFADADKLVSFAQASGMAIHGHCLVWHLLLPTWITGGNFTKPQLLAVLKDHITTVVGRYKGKIESWDVVNEAVGEDGSLRSSIWLTTIGPAYIDSAFVWAHGADPAAKLYLNDNSAEWLNGKSDSVLKVVKALKARGVPIDGVGFQTHFSMTPPAASSIRSNFDRFAKAGFDIRVSEMDVRIANGLPGLQAQAVIYRDVLDACLLLPRCKGFTTWGFTDRASWIPYFYIGFGRGLPLDSAYRPKPAFDSLAARLQRP